MTDHIIDEKQTGSSSLSRGDQKETQPSQSCKMLKISPHQVLESLSALRVEKTRIRPVESESSTVSGNSTVILAELSPAEASGPPARTGEPQYVAVKKLTFSGGANDAGVLAALAQETSLLSELSHSNIVKIIGFVEDTRDRTAWIIFPWESNGNLREFVRSAQWEFPERISLIHDVICGIEYLHSRKPPICHGDLKSLNILVNSENSAIITDFGSARTPPNHTSELGHRHQIESIKPETSENPDTNSLRIEVEAIGSVITLTGPKWTLRWAAPELLSERLPDQASDIWAFGWVCWEVLTGDLPFDGETDISTVVRIVGGRLPIIDNDARINQVKAIASIMVDCWSLNGEKRPTAKTCERGVFWMDRTTPLRRSETGSSGILSARLLSSLARMHLGQDRTAEADEYFRRSMDVARSTEDKETMAIAVMGLGHVCSSRGEYAEAEEFYTTSRNIYDQLGNMSGSAYATNSLGDINRLRGEYSKAEKSLKAAQGIFSVLGDERGLAHVANALGEVYRVRGDTSKAEEEYIVARDIYSDVGDQRGVANALDALGIIYRERGDYIEAEEYFVTSRDVYSRIGDQRGFAHAIEALGDIYYQRGESSKAEESYTTSRDIFSQTGDQVGFAGATNSLGHLYKRRKDYSRAKEAYTTARGIYSHGGDQLGFAHTTKSLGEINTMQGNLTEAEALLTTAKDIYSNIGDRVGVGNALRLLGDVFHARNEYSRCEELYIAARDVFSEIGNRVGLRLVFIGLGEVYSVLQDYSRAERSYEEARDLYSQTGSRDAVAAIQLAIGVLRLHHGHLVDAELSIREASALYAELGEEDQLQYCLNLLEGLSK